MEELSWDRALRDGRRRAEEEEEVTEKTGGRASLEEKLEQQCPQQYCNVAARWIYTGGSGYQGQRQQTLT